MQLKNKVIFLFIKANTLAINQLVLKKNMQIYKFGGASTNSVERFGLSANIIEKAASQKLVLVISAMGKMTNALEAVTDRFFEGNTEEALNLFDKIKKAHLTTLKFLTNLHWQAAENKMKDFFTEVEWLLHDKPVRSYAYYYDQIVCCGELLSSTLMYFYLLERKVNATWIDVRDLIRTDNNFREAVVDWDFTRKKIQGAIVPALSKYDVVVTQGFIAATDENESTTLGREGSDFTAAIFADCLEAEEVTIWKDVDAVMNADPKQFTDSINLPHLNYAEIIEMAYYGAQVIHPKTIKPLQNKNIVLRVKSFLHPELPGTEINNKPIKNLPALKVVKSNQVLINFSTKDFSFIEGKPVAALHKIFNTHKIKANLTQNAAISLMCCFDDQPEKIDSLAAEASVFFDVTLQRNLELITIRHYNETVIETLTKNKVKLLQQTTQQTYQAVVSNAN